MKDTPENRVKRAVRQILRQNGWMVETNLQGMGSANGRPDMEATREGVTIRIECKSPAHRTGNRVYQAGKLSPAQEKYIARLRDHGAVVFVTDDPEKFLVDLESLQEELWPGRNLKRIC